MLKRAVSLPLKSGFTYTYTDVSLNLLASSASTEAYASQLSMQLEGLELTAPGCKYANVLISLQERSHILRAKKNILLNPRMSHTHYFFTRHE